jgi:hypothetical protein
MDSCSSRVLPEKVTAQTIKSSYMIIKGFSGLLMPTVIHPVSLTQLGEAGAVLYCK